MVHVAAGGGSSPLARGGRVAAGPRVGTAGLIPARAGRTSSTRPRTIGTRAHPRSRGADLTEAKSIRKFRGSSPLARGGLEKDEWGEGSPGLIPARAGRTQKRQGPKNRTRAHPRSRGADMCGVGVALSRLWLIPARAGRTARARRPGACIRAHPRSRGADGTGYDQQALDEGSSPLARGGLEAVGGEGGLQGLIPARAGRT